MKPILKWVGGKSQLLNYIIPKIPENRKIYAEPFVGGASVFIEVLKKDLFDEYHVNDINKFLIITYEQIKNNIDLLCIELEKLENIYLNSQKPESFYYEIRDKFNSAKEENPVEIASFFIFLNKTCFRGLYREGPRGFNVPFGNYKKPCIFDRQLLTILSEKFNASKVYFYNLDFEIFVKQLDLSDTFIYFDPPYYPIKKSSFTEYNKSGFSNKHSILANLCGEIHLKNVKFVLSNSYCDVNIKLYENFEISKIEAKRRINSKNPNDKEYEILVFN